MHFARWVQARGRARRPFLGPTGEIGAAFKSPDSFVRFNTWKQLNPENRAQYKILVRILRTQPWYDRQGAVEALLKAGADARQHEQAVLAAGADVNRAAGDGATSLFIASASGHVDVVQALLAAGADVNRATQGGATPLYIASQEDHLDVVQADAVAVVEEVQLG